MPSLSIVDFSTDVGPLGSVLERTPLTLRVNRQNHQDRVVSGLPGCSRTEVRARELGAQKARCDGYGWQTMVPY